MSRLDEFTLDSTDKKSKLHVMRWLPDDGNVRAVLQIAHGIAEHIARYDTFARYMANNGFAVVGNSHLGHGLSVATEEDMGYFADSGGWDTVVDDIHQLSKLLHQTYPDKPYFILGHSMGSFLTRTYLIKYPQQFAGCILSGTGQQTGALLDVGLLMAGVEKRLHGGRRQSAHLNQLCFGAYNRRIANHRTPNDWLTRDREIVDKFTADITCGWVPTIGIFGDMLGGIKFIGNKKNVAKVHKDLPIFLIAGREDPVGDYGVGPEKVLRLYQQAGIKDVTLKLYDGARHEVLNEINREEVFSDVLQWLESRMKNKM